jgi:hypothetical protein
MPIDPTQPPSVWPHEVTKQPAKKSPKKTKAQPKEKKK